MCSAVFGALKKTVHRSAWLLALALVTACGGHPQALKVGVEAEPDANNNSPIAVAVLVVYDRGVMRELSKLSAADWFEQAEQRQRDNPDMRDFDVVSWEIMPGQRIKDLTMQLQGREAEGLVFADYLAEGEHRTRFNPVKQILVVLGKTKFNVVDVDDD